MRGMMASQDVVICRPSTSTFRYYNVIQYSKYGLNILMYLLLLRDPVRSLCTCHCLTFLLYKTEKLIGLRPGKNLEITESSICLLVKFVGSKPPLLGPFLNNCDR